MVNKNYILILSILSILLVLPIISAVDTLNSAKQNEIIELIQVCDNCTYVNLTTIRLPNSSILGFEVNMTRTGTTYNFSFTETSSIGNYIYTTCGDPDDIFTCESVSFEITPTGSKLGTAESIIYIIFLAGLVGTFALFLFGAITIPYRNQATDGRIVSINDVKYFKVICIVFSYLLLMTFFGIMRQITASYLFLNQATKTFEWLYWFMVSFAFPVIVVSIILMFVMFVQSKQMKQLLDRGVPLLERGMPLR